VNALKRKIIAHIREQGPINIAQFMEMALGDPEHGYYMTRDPFGRDFVTAPEVSQIFGEMLGLFFVQAWEDRSRPKRFHFVELGPGRGTLMADMLRAAHKVRPDFATAAQLTLVETSPKLRKVQAQTLVNFRPNWVTRFEDVPDDAPLFLIANEFFDALPIRQFVKSKQGWHQRMVTEDGNDLRFTPAPDIASSPSSVPIDMPEGSVLEINEGAVAIVQQIGPRLDDFDGVTLIIDYGYVKSTFGDTLQAVKDNAYVDPLAEPGDADLTAHVDFGALSRAASAAQGYVLGPIPQAALLECLGIAVRAERLKRQNPEKASEIAAAVERLTHPSQMGTLFKALTIYEGLDREQPPGFDDACGPGHE